jgi:hypothetical protein
VVLADYRKLLFGPTDGAINIQPKRFMARRALDLVVGFTFDERNRVMTVGTTNTDWKRRRWRGIFNGEVDGRLFPGRTRLRWGVQLEAAEAANDCPIEQFSLFVTLRTEHSHQ